MMHPVPMVSLNLLWPIRPSKGLRTTPLILPRSIYIGSGKPVTHRTSDSKGTWESWDITGMGILINMNSMCVENLIQMLLYLDLVIIRIQVQVRIMNQLKRRRFVSIVTLVTHQGWPRSFFYTYFQNGKPLVPAPECHLDSSIEKSTGPLIMI